MHPEDSFIGTVVDDLDEIVFSLDADGDWTFLNAAWERISGFGRKESLGRPSREYLHPDERNDVGEAVEGTREIRFRRRDGGFWWGKVRARRVPDESGAPAGLRGVIADVTACRPGPLHAEPRPARQHLESILEASPAIMFTADPERGLATTWISHNVEAAMGVPASDLVNHPHLWRDCIHPEDREAILAAGRSLAADTPNVNQFRYRHANGELRWMRCDTKLVEGAGDKPPEIIGCLLDITETLEALENLRYREAILEGVSFVAKSFLHGQEWEEAILAALERLGKAAMADQVLLIEKVAVAGASPKIKLRYAWTRDRSGGMSGTFPAGVDTPVGPGFPVWEEALDCGEIIAGRVATMSAPERAVLEPEGVQAIAIIPVFVGATRWGTIGFSRGADAAWSPAILDGLRVAAGIIGAGMQQTETRHRLRRAQQELEDRVRRRTEELAATNRALEQSEQLYRALVETCPDAILVSDLEHRIRMVNPRGMELLRWNHNGETGDVFMHSFYRPEDRDFVQRARAELMTSGRIASVDLTLVRRDGSTFQAETSASLVRGPGGEPRYILRIVRDISARRQLEEQFRQAQKMEAVGRLAGGIAHDFNNLLTVIQGYGELLLKRVSADPGNGRKATQIVKAAERAAGLVEQLLAFSRRQMVEPKIVDVNPAIRDLEKMLRRLIGEDIEFVTQLHPQAGSVRVDPGQLDQLIMNLAVNARDAISTSGAITISTSPFQLQPDAEPPCAEMPPGAFVCMEVRDTGAGMTEEVVSHIFEPFFTTKPVGKGTGLGLSTVYGVIQQSRGFIAVETAPGAGTAFRIYLPAVDRQSDAAAPEPSPQSLAACHETILVTEDSSSVRAMVVETLREYGYTVLEATHGRHALDVARQFRGAIDMLVTDVVMPRMGGAELWKTLSPMFPAMRLLFITGYAEQELPAGLPFLKKPFAPDVLACRVREILDRV